MNTISFPGLGISPFTVHEGFEIPIFGGFKIHWYGVIITLGIALAFLYCYYRCKQAGISYDTLFDITLFTVIFGILGARTYYVVMRWDTYENLWEMLAIWNGGLAIYGGIIAGAITVFVMCRIKKISFLKMGDIAAPAVMIGQLVGRWGNFVNGEAHGGVIPESSPLYFIRMGLSKDGGATYYVHPTFLYESLWNLLGFILIQLLYKKRKFDGQVILMYVSWYGFGRMFIESLRTDSLMIGGDNGIRVSQLVGFLCFVVGTTLLIVQLIRVHNTKKHAVPAQETINQEPVDVACETEEISDSQPICMTKEDIQKKLEDPIESQKKGDDQNGEHH